MASYTPNLNLLMKDPVADGADTFNIETMLNQNWEKIDRQVLLAMAAAAAYDAGTTYRKGDFCSQGGLLHRANQDIAQPEAWTAGHWAAISITDVIRGLAAADVGAAPGGYGFGDAIQEIAAASAEESYETYCAKVDAVLDGMPDKTAKLVRAYPPAMYGNAGTTISLLYKSDANYAVLSNIGSADMWLCGWRMFKQRYPSSSDPSVWLPFEWEHPPMRIGVEYRTVERYNGKPVYAKAINFGQAPNATYKEVSHGIEDFSQLVSYTGMMGGANLIEAPALDNILINASIIRITTNTDASGSYVYLVLRYIKTTD
nr:MAG TPA: hypothetical protein [Caudoviricetes sp.]